MNTASVEKVFASRALAAVERELDGLDAEFVRLACSRRASASELVQWRDSQRRHLERWRARLAAGGVAARGRRRMPSLKRIAAVNNLGPVPRCVRCGYSEGGEWGYTSSWLERAHVIDRCFDGLDVEANLRPLCSPCHKRQPIFKPGDEERALAWFEQWTANGSTRKGTQ